MLKIKIVVVDKTRAPFLSRGETFYLERVRRYAPTEWIEVKPARIKKGRSEANILKTEGEAIQKRVNEQDYVFALDLSGKPRTSENLARRIEQLSLSRDRLCFIIGGPLGLSAEILSNRADERLSLSEMTLTHEMTRIILLEQIYRAFTILRGEKYHK
ncbi:MAG: 23S rRNA (pseudouridine(1915)-N(3))-methyltransferase RlmH [Deltaproteobacteria bacterium]|nr:23S rRNA (pseudouridine(1915)-N(3))-methyltransferase RlmH [Deltaproteobacteria bacterium]